MNWLNTLIDLGNLALSYKTVNNLNTMIQQGMHIDVDSNIKAFMNLLARKNQPKGHEECPCGSGLRLRNCHTDLVRKAREQVDRQDVCEDISTIEQSLNKG